MAALELLLTLPQLDVAQLLIAIGRGLWQRMQLLPQHLEFDFLGAPGLDKFLQVRGQDLERRHGWGGRTDVIPCTVQLLVGSPGRRKGGGIELFQRLDRFFAG